MKATAQPPRSVPVLTEVVVMPKAAPEVAEEYPPVPPDPAYAETAPAPLAGWPGGLKDAVVAPPAGVDEAMLTQRVLADLDKQLDLMFEQRLRETLTPVLARMTDTLVREMRNQLAGSLRELVSQAVSRELDRLQKR
ncbi:MAG TPA: hypothetical protein VHQ87_03500 [Rhizobacter sp.]|jgi:hypothetical protein|nr:hypothetical protein [Rhizobacter sp.]